MKIKALKTINESTPINVQGKPLPMDTIREVTVDNEIKNLIFHKYIEEVSKNKK